MSQKHKFAIVWARLVLTTYVAEVGGITNRQTTKPRAATSHMTGSIQGLQIFTCSHSTTAWALANLPLALLTSSLKPELKANFLALW